MNKVRVRSVLFCAVFGVVAGVCAMAKVPEFRIAVFDADVTPSIGSPVAYASARKIEHPLSARGIVLFPTGQEPVVLCAVDAIGIANDGLDEWREALADAAETTIERVTVHALHQHDCPRYDFASEALMHDHGCGGKYFDNEFCRDVIARTADAARDACRNTEPATHVGVGKALVEKVASNRRVVVDGKVGKMRGSSCNDPFLIAAPEGIIDPYLRMVSFWNGEKALASLMYYATHPMSHYGKGDVTPDFVGLARDHRQKETGVPHIYFTGAAGNVAAGKYNDGSPEMRPVLTQRMESAMKQAWENQKREPVFGSDIEWRTKKVALPLAAHMTDEKLAKKIAVATDCNGMKWDLMAQAWLNRCKAGRKITLSRLRLGENLHILHMPGELFVEYQLAAQAMRPGDAVCMAAYGQYGPWYIGTEEAYEQGGYEVKPDSSLVAPSVEDILMNAMRDLLK